MLRQRNNSCGGRRARSERRQTFHCYLGGQLGADEKATDAKTVSQQREEGNDGQKTIKTLLVNRQLCIAAKEASHSHYQADV